jgi:hypothetical protein
VNKTSTIRHPKKKAIEIIAVFMICFSNFYNTNERNEAIGVPSRTDALSDYYY